ncbi:MAG: phenylalanine--tRNA ligase subunit beta, partial [Methylobacterium sp.]|nr:phenylalanine--tRNA ligase subunit beta [Methylobacterium sp.]
MKFSEIWLRSFVNPALDSAALDHVLTMAGLEVEAMDEVAPNFHSVVVAEILSAEKHPDADRLQVCRVDIGRGDPLQIVCGAPNARAGLKAPCALVGAELPGGLAIRQAKVRGVTSAGMMCSARELGIAETSEGLLELPEEAPVGQDIRTYLELDDKLFTLKLTPNRSDCLSLLGIARDVSALTGAPMCQPEIQPVASASSLAKNVSVAARQACPRYCGRVVQGVNAGAATPAWMVRRLERSGLRSISAIVDITNYVLLELGQPLHAFDLARLRGDLAVRFAAAGETLELLNQQTVALQDDMLVIADGQGPVALAGIMGGAATAVSAQTTDIFLESAFFAPSAITGRARRLGFSTDASYRFERGVDFGATRHALERATRLVMDICGGTPGPVTEVAGELPARLPVRLRGSRAAAVLGIPLDADTISALLGRLGLPFEHAGDVWMVTPPSRRFDLAIEEDLIEELARMHGYQHLPATPPQSPALMLPASESVIAVDRLRDRLAAAGYHEAVTYSFVDEAWERDLQGNTAPVRLRNPIASNMNVMRSSLWGGLLDALSYNLNRKQQRVRLFEIGACFSGQAGAYAETSRLAGVCYGSAVPEQWGAPAREVDFYDIKADVEALTGGRARFEAGNHPALHPGQCARVWLDGREVGWLGGLHPQWQQRYQFAGNVMLFELDVSALRGAAVARFSGVSKFPPVRRDLALVVDETLPVQALL